MDQILLSFHIEGVLPGESMQDTIDLFKVPGISKVDLMNAYLTRTALQSTRRLFLECPALQ